MVARTSRKLDDSKKPLFSFEKCTNMQQIKKCIHDSIPIEKKSHTQRNVIGIRVVSMMKKKRATHEVRGQM